MFEDFFNDDKTAMDFLNKLYSKDDIEIKTDLNMMQIKTLCKIKYHSLLLQKDRKDFNIIINELLEYYLTLLVSYKRKSRAEAENILTDMLKKEMLNKAKAMDNLTK